MALDSKIESMTKIDLDVYNVGHSLNSMDVKFKEAGIASSIICKAWFIKKALQEFKWVDDSEVLWLETR